MDQTEALAGLLAPCNESGFVADREISVRSVDHISHFKTLNGSSRYVYKVNGRSVAALHIKRESQHTPVIANFYTHPDYQGAGFLADLYRVAVYDNRVIRMGRSLEQHPQILDLIQTLQKV